MKTKSTRSFLTGFGAGILLTAFVAAAFRWLSTWVAAETTLLALIVATVFYLMFRDGERSQA